MRMSIFLAGFPAFFIVYFTDILPPLYWPLSYLAIAIVALILAPAIYAPWEIVRAVIYALARIPYRIYYPIAFFATLALTALYSSYFVSASDSTSSQIFATYQVSQSELGGYMATAFLVNYVQIALLCILVGAPIDMLIARYRRSRRAQPQPYQLVG